ncbi:hypothetical protein [Candidatus Halobonum tyrrellensis]|uniref:Uncharacterized protein n=1 Tax=Candidatus Halobonum tyrrellensis G22 TaxID=1324957 RepID=V4HLE9_9EURY|nr:hypothetical protein [Candidatus Halobonum tyrrellensis]ESP88754.1 hypothetical protein K933_07418 [Candidatus Halobonum tyrrellensis G22]
MIYHDRLLTLAVAVALVGLAGVVGADVPLTPAHRPKPTAAERTAAIDRRAAAPAARAETEA